jgi:hypothetical protein
VPVPVMEVTVLVVVVALVVVTVLVAGQGVVTVVMVVMEGLALVAEDPVGVVCQVLPAGIHTLSCSTRRHSGARCTRTSPTSSSNDP